MNEQEFPLQNPSASQNQDEPSRSIFWETVQTVIIAFVIAQIVVHFIAQPHHVQGASMEPSFHNGNYILTDKLTYLLRDPKRGEIVVFQPPSTNQVEYIKRVVGLPGETVIIEDGIVKVNGHPLEESYLQRGEPSLVYSETTRGSSKAVLGPHQYFLMGDNRDNSYDSRHFGPVQETRIEGRAILRYWPIGSLDIFLNRN